MVRIPRHSPCTGPGDLGPLWAWMAGVSGATPPLESSFHGRLEDRRLVATPTGRHALWAYLEAAGLRPGDEVLVPAYNFHVVVALVIQRGLRPVFVDVDPTTLCLCPDALAARISPRTRLVLATHMFGHPAPMAAVAELCRRRGLLLFEDCAHAVGTVANGRPAGVWGDGALFSFGIYKLLNGLGGGMLALPRDSALQLPAPLFPQLREGLGALSEHLARAAVSMLMAPPLYGGVLKPLLDAVPPLGQAIDPPAPDPDYAFDPAGRAPFRPFMAALVARQLARLDAQLRRRREIGRLVAEGIAGLDGVRPLAGDAHGQANGSYLGVWCRDAPAVARQLADAGVDTSAQEFIDCAAFPAFAAYGADCPGAATAAAHTLRLPSYPCMSDGQVDRMIRALQRAGG